MADIRIGVIGAGGLSINTHLPALQEMQDVTIAAICDEVEDKAAQAAQKFAIPSVYGNYRKMLSELSVGEDLDGIFVLTQPDRLFRIVLDSISAGLPVFMEKPPGITLYQAKTLERESRDRDVPIQVGFNRRYIPVVAESLRILREHSTITHVEGRFYKNGDPSFYNGCASAFECDTIHCIDFIRYIADSKPVSAVLLETCTGGPVADVWQGLVKFENGVTGTVRAHYKTGGRVHDLELHGPGGSAFINLGFGDDSCEADIIRHDGEGSFSLASQGSKELNRIHLDGRELANSQEFHHYYGFFDEDRAFINSLKSGTAPDCDISEGAKTMSLVKMFTEHKM